MYMNESPGKKMDSDALELKRLSVDELSDLYDRVRQALTERIQSEKQKLEEKLVNLNAGPAAQRQGSKPVAVPIKSRRRGYPAVRPKYKNPDNSAETWAGRGKQPRWLVAQLEAGKRIEDFLIE